MKWKLGIYRGYLSSILLHTALRGWVEHLEVFVSGLGLGVGPVTVSV